MSLVAVFWGGPIDNTDGGMYSFLSIVVDQPRYARLVPMSLVVEDTMDLVVYDLGERNEGYDISPVQLSERPQVERKNRSTPLPLLQPPGTNIHEPRK